MADGPHRTRYVDVDSARLFCSESGAGDPIVVLHGGPDFDHTYLLPEMDRLAERFRVICYDQRGRGRSADGVQAEDVSIDSEVNDLESLRHALGLETFTVLGHSWGGLLAIEYAIRHAERLDGLVLLGTAPASHADILVVRRHLAARRSPSERSALLELGGTSSFQRGDLDADRAYYRVHFEAALSDPAMRELLVERLRAHFTPASLLLARAIERRLYAQTWERSDYDLLPDLAGVTVPTLVLQGEHDFLGMDAARHIADAAADGELVVLSGCGHFPHMERPGETFGAIESFMAQDRRQSPT